MLYPLHIWTDLNTFHVSHAAIFYKHYLAGEFGRSPFGVYPVHIKLVLVFSEYIETADDITSGDVDSSLLAEIKPFSMSSSPELANTTYSEEAFDKLKLKAAQMPSFLVRNIFTLG